MNITKTFAVCLASVLFAVACTERNEPQETKDTIRIDTGSSVDLETGNVLVSSPLKKFDDCDQLLRHLRTTYAEKAEPWGFLSMPYYQADYDATYNERRNTATTEEDTEEEEDVVHMGTNIWKAQVSEDDIITTDGRRIYVAFQTEDTPKLSVADVETREIVDTVELAGRPLKIFMHDDKLIMIQYSKTDLQVIIQSAVLDDKGLPKIDDTIRIDGSYSQSFKINDTVYILIRHSNYKSPGTFPFVTPVGDSETSEKQAKQSNKEALLNSTLEDWLPNYYHDDDEQPAGFLSSCDKTYAPWIADDLGVTSLISLPFAEQFSVDHTVSVIASLEDWHASTGSLFLSHNLVDHDHRDGLKKTDNTVSYVHRFSISEGKAEYISSGTVPGYVMPGYTNRQSLSMSEHEGYLRIISTLEDINGNLDTGIRVFDIDTNPMTEIGSIKLENAMAEVRTINEIQLETVPTVPDTPAYMWFAGDVGYVVTYLRTEPIYTVDLSDPTNPRMLGNLDMPGFTTYLHPINETMILGVSSTATSPYLRQVTGTKVSLFDVSDLSAPKELDVWTEPNAIPRIGGEHKAFAWSAPDNLAVVPVTLEGDNPETVILSVKQGNLVETGRIAHKAEDMDNEKRSNDILRSMVIGGELWTLARTQGADSYRTRLALQVNDLSTFERLSYVPLPTIPR